jgi:hypothetical protein
MATGTMTTEQKLPFTFAPTSPQGNPATLDGAIQAEVISGDATVEVSADGLSGFIIAGSTVGAAQVRFFGDADLSVGVRTIEEIADIQITNAEAAVLGLSFGTAVPK